MNDDINISNDRDLLDDDTTGQGLRGKPAPAVDDTDGHLVASKRVRPAEDDTDGHMGRGKGLTPADDDTDGHATRPGR